MSAVKDARVQTTLPAHPKTKRLLRTLGAEGGWFLIRLFLWAAENRSDGDLSGIADEDIELAIDWPGTPRAFVAALLASGFLEGGELHREIHDWAAHNGWANGATARSAKARWNAIKRHHGEAVADREVPEYRAGSNASSSADRKTPALRLVASSNAPSPSPSPSKREAPPKKPGGSSPIELKTFIAQCKATGVAAIPAGDPVFTYADSVGLSREFIALAWEWFKDRMEGKRKKDWRAHFRNAVKENWPKLWYRVSADDGWALTTAGIQAQLAQQAGLERQA
jgi:hypothetical protein